MTDPTVTDSTNGQEQPDVSLTEQWQAEQRSWQQLMLSYADSAAKDEGFLIHVGNALRGSLLAGKAYPGTTLETPRPIDATMANDEVVFALRRLEGQVRALTSALDELSRRLPAGRGVTDQL